MKNYNSALIIDDDLDLCLMLKSILNNSINEVRFAQSVEAGKTLLKEMNPDVVFLDNNFPDGQGLDLIRSIKVSSPSTFIIFSTAVDSFRNEALQNGADLFLPKPLTYKSITRALRKEAELKTGV